VHSRSLLLSLGLLLVASPAHADRRAFTHTYEYMTMPEAETELEIYSTQTKTAFGDDPTPRSYELMLEIEHGITSKWDVALYHVFDQATGPGPDDNESFHFAEMKLETRYRFAERGEWPVDVLVYGEGVKVFGEGVYEAEAKIILARDFDKLTAVLNMVGEVVFDPRLDEPELEAGWAAGLTYEVMPEWKVGAESWGDAEVEELDETLAGYVGPVVSWAPSSGLWVAVTPGFGVTDAADDLNVRLAVGLHIR
jgi:hypothetical protein